jgi:2-methylcitrate dehydratase PrpD
MPISPTIIQALSTFAAAESDFSRLSPELLYLSKEMMVNAAAVGLAGAAQQDGQTVTRFAQDMVGNGRCTIIGKGLRTSPVYAALTNGVLIRLLDFDDEIPGSGVHPASVIFPVVMALGEMNGLPGRDVLAAFAAGCEVVSKLQSLFSEVAARKTEPDPQMPVSSGTAAALGATASAGKLLRLSEPDLLQALLLAYPSPGADLAVGNAGPVQAYGQGRAAMAGTMAALLAQQGLKAMPGFPGLSAEFAATAGPTPSTTGLDDCDLALGSPYDLISRGVSLKLYPCASQAHPVIDASLQLLQQYRFSADEVSAVRVGVTPSALAALPFPIPANGWQARACVSFVVASTLVYGHPLIDNFTDAAVADPRVRGLMARVSVEATETPMTSIPFPASVAITLNDGRQLSHRAEFARGLADLPLTTEELDAKFLYCSRYILPPDHIEEAVTRLRDLENIENTTGLFSVLGG